jgi:hypothetical protein
VCYFARLPAIPGDLYEESSLAENAKARNVQKALPQPLGPPTRERAGKWLVPAIGGSRLILRKPFSARREHPLGNKPWERI